MSQNQSTVIRGTLAYVVNDPFIRPSKECLQYELDGLIVAQDGQIVPGFIDTHVHDGQTLVH